jgi:hypothetical protein
MSLKRSWRFRAPGAVGLAGIAIAGAAIAAPTPALALSAGRADMTTVSMVYDAAHSNIIMDDSKIIMDDSAINRKQIRIALSYSVS